VEGAYHAKCTDSEIGRKDVGFGKNDKNILKKYGVCYTIKTSQRVLCSAHAEGEQALRLNETPFGKQKEDMQHD
jgi:hypothetical protein